MIRTCHLQTFPEVSAEADPLTERCDVKKRRKNSDMVNIRACI
jgi:hypothetical protein